MAELVRGSEVDRVPLEEQRREIRVCDAGPVLQLMNLPLDGDDIDFFRVIPTREVLKKIADVCNLVVLLQESLLPSLRRLPTEATHLVMMDACAQKLKEYARAVGGGSFNVSCTEFARRVNSYTADARGNNTANDASLRDSIDDLVVQASRFLDMTYTDEAEAEAEDEA